MQADLVECLETGKDTGHVVRGVGSALTLTVAGATHHQRAITWAAARAAGEPAPAVVLREPTNPYDPNAIRVIAHGVLVGYLSRDDARQWQSLLLECERCGVHLAAVARFRKPDSRGLVSVRLSIRPNLPGFTSSIVEERREKQAAVAANREVRRQQREAERQQEAAAAAARAARARPMTPEEWSSVSSTLEAIVHADFVRTKSAASAAVKVWWRVRGHVEAHADALGGADESNSGHDSLADVIEHVNDAAIDLLAATDADQREDLHSGFQCEIEDLLQALTTSIEGHYTSMRAD